MPPPAPKTNGVVDGANAPLTGGKQKLTRNQLKREKKKARKHQAGNETETETTASEAEVRSSPLLYPI